MHEENITLTNGFTDSMRRSVSVSFYAIKSEGMRKPLRSHIELGIPFCVHSHTEETEGSHKAWKNVYDSALTLHCN